MPTKNAYQVIASLSTHHVTLPVVLPDGVTLTSIVEKYRHNISVGNFILKNTNKHSKQCSKSCNPTKVIRVA